MRTSFGAGRRVYSTHYSQFPSPVPSLQWADMGLTLTLVEPLRSAGAAERPEERGIEGATKPMAPGSATAMRRLRDKTIVTGMCRMCTRWRSLYVDQSDAFNG